jgi:hypothetical protein
MGGHLHGQTERELAAEALERELHLPVHAHGLHTGGQVVGRGRRRHARWPRFIAGMVVVGALFGLVIAGLLRVADGPVTAQAVRPSPGRVAVTAQHSGANQLGSLYIELTYPATFDVVGRVKTSAVSLEQFTLTSQTNPSRSIAIDVRPLPAGGLSEESSYRFRQLSKTIYEPSNRQLAGESVVIMVKRDGTEQTLFWAHGANLVTVSLTSSDPHDNLETIMSGLATGLRWKRV